MTNDTLLVIIAGVRGAVATTVAAAAAALHRQPPSILAGLTSSRLLAGLNVPPKMQVAGWDYGSGRLTDNIRSHGVLPQEIWGPYSSELSQVPVLKPPAAGSSMKDRVTQIGRDIRFFKNRFHGFRAVFVNLLPAAPLMDTDGCHVLDQLYDERTPASLPDLAYVLAALENGLPVVNFSPNEIELPVIIDEARRQGVPVAGCDGKTGQTYFKVVLASAFKARNLTIDGWYSVNILGNADGANLKDPRHAAGKIANKTELLDDILGYRVGESYGCCTHSVHIGYYPPRGDAKEAWDVIDFKGLFGLPMSLRLNLQGRDSILAAPLVMDLVRWMGILQQAGYRGNVPELAFYFKRPRGANPPLTFEDQLSALKHLAAECQRRVSGKEK